MHLNNNYHDRGDDLILLKKLDTVAHLIVNESGSCLIIVAQMISCSDEARVPYDHFFSMTFAVCDTIQLSEQVEELWVVCDL